MDALLSRGYKVHAIARTFPGLLSPSALIHPNLTCFPLDITDLSSLQIAIDGSEIIYHLACNSLPHTSNKNPHVDVSVNLLGSINLLEAARKLSVRRVIFLSSGGTVYGNPQTIPLTEYHPTDPICSYGITKLSIEKYIGLYSTQFGLNGLVFRVANPYGVRQRLYGSQGVIPIFLGKVLRSESLNIWGDGSTIRDFIYISDLVSALVLAINYDGPHSVFNVGSGIGFSINELINFIETIVKRPLVVNYLPSRDVDVPSNILCINRAVDALKWTPQVHLLEGIKLFYRSLT